MVACLGKVGQIQTGSTERRFQWFAVCHQSHLAVSVEYHRLKENSSRQCLWKKDEPSQIQPVEYKQNRHFIHLAIQSEDARSFFVPLFALLAPDADSIVLLTVCCQTSAIIWKCVETYNL